MSSSDKSNGDDNRKLKEEQEKEKQKEDSFKDKKNEKSRDDDNEKDQDKDNVKEESKQVVKLPKEERQKAASFLKKMLERRGSEVPKDQMNLARRRLSMMSGAIDVKTYHLDGYDRDRAEREPKEIFSPRRRSIKTKHHPIVRHAESTKVGYAPFNPGKVNQDRYITITDFGRDKCAALFGVFDGHGSLGHDVAEMIALELPSLLQNQQCLTAPPTAPNSPVADNSSNTLNDEKDETGDAPHGHVRINGNTKINHLSSNPPGLVDVPLALNQAFVQMHHLLKTSSVDCTFSGATGVVVYFSGDKLWIGSAGDSRAVLATRRVDLPPLATALSRDHKPDIPEERQRIIHMGGRVHACKGPDGEDIGPARVWMKHDDIPGLAMSRSLGDLLAQSVGVSCVPETSCHTLTQDDLFIVIASDGVWEFMSNQDVVELVASADDPEAACAAVVEESTRRWQKEEEVIDDITCVVAFFR